ncbi:uncharacterized protein LOC123307623 [Coccinella septempunctata]|uniref:uncharacterized protein LOC123307623 n=1 Tax=Coccinella septempunctata TaxID=41139 RepID=UPI001D084DAE|nr:uncharacterized protein LOC123307623 [Coccinella septempunctata]
MKTKKLKISKKDGGLKHAGGISELPIEKSDHDTEMTNVSVEEIDSKNEGTVSIVPSSNKASRRSKEGENDNDASSDRQYEKKKKKRKHNCNLDDAKFNTDITEDNTSEMHSSDINTKAVDGVVEVKKTKKLDDPNPRKKAIKNEGSENINSQEWVKDDSFVSIYPESPKKRKVASDDLPEKKERKKKKGNMSLFISPALLAGLTPDTSHPAQACKEEEEESSENQPKKKKHDKCLNSQFADAPEGKSTSCSESKTMFQSKKSSKLPTIPNSVLDNLLLKFDKIVEEDKKKQEEIEAAKNKCLYVKKKEKKCSQDSSEDENLEIARRDGPTTNKKKIIELMKETKSIERIKDELNMETDNVEYQKLKTIKFEVPWPLPTIHKIARHVSVSPTAEQRKQLEGAGIKLKLGKYTKEEDAKIKKNWQLFCQYHGWDVDNYIPFLLGSQQSRYGYIPTKKFKKFVQFISHNFEDRLMYNIYIRFKRIFGQKERRNFTPEDDEIILEYLNTSKATKPFADLANLLKRPRIAVLKRYQKLITDQLFDPERIYWDKCRTKKLFLTMLEVTGVKEFSDLKERRITGEEWKKISTRMDIPSDKIKRVWYMDFYTRVFNPKFDEDFTEIRQELIETLSENYNDWREIDWKTLAKKFDSFTSPRLYKMFTDLVRSRVPKEKLKDFKACLEHLKENSKRKKPTCRFKFIQEVLGEIDDEES